MSLHDAFRNAGETSVNPFVPATTDAHAELTGSIDGDPVGTEPLYDRTAEPPKTAAIKYRAARPPRPIPYVPYVTAGHEAADLAESATNGWSVIRRWRILILCAALAGIMAGLAVSVMQSPAYRTKTTIEVQNINDNFLNTKQIMPLNEGGGSGYLSDIQTQINILQSDQLLDHAVQNVARRKLTPTADTGWLAPVRRWAEQFALGPPASFNDELRRVRQSVQARAVGQTRVIEITAESVDAALAAELLNEVALAFIDQNLKARLKMSDDTAESLSRLLNNAKARLEESESALQAYAASAGLAFTADNKNVGHEKLRQLQDELARAEADRISKQSRFEIARSSPVSALPEVVNSRSGRDYESVLADLRRQRAEMVITYTPDQTKVKRLDAQIAVIERALQSEEKSILGRIQNQYQEAVRRQELLKNEYKAQAQLVRDLDQRSIRYNVLQQQVDGNRKVYEAMLQRVKEATIASAIPTSNLRVLDPAVPADRPYRPNVPVNCGLGASVFTFLVVIIAFMRERTDSTLKTVEDGALRLDIPELGVVFHDRNKSLLQSRSSGPWIRKWGRSEDRRPSPLETPDMAESLRSVATSILLTEPGHSAPGVITVVSAGPGEGKTTIVVNVGLALAETGRKVLLIDGDLYRGCLHEFFQLSNRHGLSTLLESPPAPRDPVSGFVQATFQPNLFVLSTGPRPSQNPSRVMHSPHLLPLIRQFRRAFDIVLIDTPPLLQIANARLLTTVSDGVALVARARRTSLEAVAAARRRLATDKAHVLGLILNDWEAPVSLRGYYRYNGSKYAQQEGTTI